MRRLFTSRWNILAAAFLGLATLLPTTPAKAGAVVVATSYKTVTVYEWVTVYETRSEPYTRVVTCYDSCGKAYYVTKTYYRTVEVPVKKLVAVKKLVPCY